MRKLWVKRIICFFLVICLFTGSFAIIPTQKVHSAEYVAGIVGAIGGAPVLTALLIGGTVVAGGIAIHEIVTSTPEDRANFVNGVKQSFQGFVTEYEKNLLIQTNAQITEQEALQQAEQKAVSVISNFTDNALNVGNTTKNKLTAETAQLWKKYSQEINSLLDSGKNPNIGEMTPTSEFKPPVFNQTSYDLTANTLNGVGSNTIEYNGYNYCLEGQTWSSSNNPLNQNNVPTDRYRFWFCVIMFELYTSNTMGRIYDMACYVDINRLSGNIVASGYKTYSAWDWYNKNNPVGAYNSRIQACNVPVLCVNGIENGYGNFTPITNTINEVKKNIPHYISVNATDSTTPEYKKIAYNTYSDTKLGNSIQTGRRTLVNNGSDDIQGVFEIDHTPVKRSSLTQTQQGVYTGSVGWDIPASDVWDDVITGDKPFPYVAGKTGALDVPDNAITDTDDPNEIDFPEDTAVDDPAVPDDPDNPVDPDKPIKDIIDEQGGLFSPTGMDITGFFPFCIPFDIYYLFHSLVATPETPTFDIEFAYPQSLRPYLGNSFVYTLDFSDFEVVARILKIMLSLLFIFGLMKITRSIIRG